MKTVQLTLEDLAARMERLPLSGVHKKIFALTAAGYLFDAFDIALLSFIMPALAKDLGLTPVQIRSHFQCIVSGDVCWIPYWRGDCRLSRQVEGFQIYFIAFFRWDGCHCLYP